MLFLKTQVAIGERALSYKIIFLINTTQKSWNSMKPKGIFSIVDLTYN